MDKIVIRDLAVTTIIGTLPHERTEPRELIVNIELSLNLAPAGNSDDLTCSVDYQEIANKIVQLGKESRFLLIERFAECAAAICLANELVESARVTVDKPGAIGAARSVAVTIERSR